MKVKKISTEMYMIVRVGECALLLNVLELVSRNEFKQEYNTLGLRLDLLLRMGSFYTKESVRYTYNVFFFCWLSLSQVVKWYTSVQVVNAVAPSIVNNIRVKFI